MKKTLIMLLAASACAFGTEYTYNATMLGSEDKASVHGFSFTLTAANIAPANASTPTITDLDNQVLLTGFTLGDRNSAAGDAVDFGLLVLDGSKTIIGMSNSVCTPCDGVNNEFSFANLLINKNTTYTFIMVRDIALNEAYLGMTYGGDKATAMTVNTDTNVLTGGLLATGVAVDLHTGTPTTGELNFTTSSELGINQNGWSPILTNITVETVPEPATATLSLLALAGLAARRRRR